MKILLKLLLVIAFLPSVVLAQVAINDIDNGKGTSLATGTIDANGEYVRMNKLSARSAMTVSVYGTHNGTLAFQASTDGTNYVAINCFAPTSTSAVTGLTTTQTGTFQCPVGAYTSIQVIATAWTSGSVTAKINTSYGSSSVLVGSAGGGGGGGDATAANQVLQTDELITINAALAGPLDVSGSDVTASLTTVSPVGLVTSAIYSGTTALTPKYAIIDAASSGDNTLLAAVASKKIRVLSLFLVCAGTTTTRFESGASGTALTGQMNMVANSGYVLPFNPVGYFETAVNTLLNLELSAAISCDGNFTYVEV